MNVFRVSIDPLNSTASPAGPCSSPEFAGTDLTALFGSVEIVVPREWNVEMDVLPIFGGAADDRPLREAEGDEVDLVVSGFAAFDGVSVED